MDLFDTYDADFEDLGESIRERIHKMKRVSGDERRELLEEAESEIADAEAVLQSMSFQARSVPSGEQVEAQGKVRRHEQELRELKKEMKRAEIAFTTSNNRDDLFAGATEMHVTSMDHRDRMRQTTRTMEGSNRDLEDARVVLDGVIDTGGDILVELDEQNNLIYRMRQKLLGVNDNLATARNVLHKMGRRVVMNKLIMLFIVLFLIAIIGVVIYIKFFWNSGSSSSSSSSSIE